MKIYLENIISEISYDDLGIWRLPDVKAFSFKKELFDYQQDAVKSIITELSTHNYHSTTDN